jgi:hypothetical protein
MGTQSDKPEPPGGLDNKDPPIGSKHQTRVTMGN